MYTPPGHWTPSEPSAGAWVKGESLLQSHCRLSMTEQHLAKTFSGTASIEIGKGQFLVTAVLLPSTPVKRGKQVCRPLLLPVKRIGRYSPMAILEREKGDGSGRLG